MQELKTRGAPNLFTPIELGPLKLRNRVVMAPLTRSRAGPGNVPTQLNALYYAQRASAGLIISEATQIAPEGQGYISTPGIHSAEQIAGWKCVTQAVHVAGGRIVCQLWHVGRISHPSFQPGGKAPVAPSAIKPDGKPSRRRASSRSQRRAPSTLAEIPAIVEQYAQAARNALAAGFDGVEVHAANGYLIDQFLRDRTNQRTDRYGGSIENRSRFLMEVVDAVIAAVGAERTGVRISPQNTQNDIADSDPQALFNYVCRTAVGKRPRLSPHHRRRHLRHPGAAVRLQEAQAPLRRDRHQPTMASTRPAPTRPSPRDAPISSPSASPSSPIRTW